MIKVLEDRARQLEDEYLENTLSNNGNVFNAWNPIKSGGTGVASLPTTYTSKSNIAIQSGQNKRIRKLSEKDKEKERIYMLSVAEKSLR